MRKIGSRKSKAGSRSCGAPPVDSRLPIPGSRLGERGFTLVAVVIAISILSIMIAAVAPAVSTIMRRDREAELIFRGKQYARAIGLFQRRYGRYPTSLEEMYETRPRTIRKLWKDPTCNCDDWFLLIQGQPDSVPAVDLGGPRPPSTFEDARRPTPGIFGPREETKNVGPIAGVRSKVHKEALREWRGRRYYDEWRFIVGDADADAVPFSPDSLRMPATTPTP
ncbi:MAG: type II secretion system protein [Thermoanaerobaculia bacterium]